MNYNLVILIGIIISIRAWMLNYYCLLKVKSIENRYLVKSFA